MSACMDCADFAAYLGQFFTDSLSSLLTEHDSNITPLTITRRQILDSSKLQEFADDYFKFGKNERKLSKQVENTAGKGEIARYEQFLLFPQCLPKACF